MKNIKKKKGFTLIELIIVIAIIGILAMIAVPKFGDIQKKSKIKADIATAKTISDAVSVLVTQGRIAETVAESAITTAAAADSTTPVDDEDAAAQIGRYLQSIPTSSLYKGNNFWVTVEDGNATIFVTPTAGDGDENEGTIEIYPTPSAGSEYVAD